MHPVRIQLDDGFLGSQQYLHRIYAVQSRNGMLDMLGTFRTIHPLDRDFNCLIDRHIYYL